MLRTLLNRPVYRASAKVLVPIPPDPKSVRVVGDAAGEIELIAAATPASISAQMDEMTSRSAVEKAIQEVGIVPRGGVKIPTVKAEVADPYISDVVKVTVEGGDPKDVAKLANRLVDMHVERMARLQSRGLTRAIEFLSAERNAAAASA